MQNEVEKIELLLKFNRGELSDDAEKDVKEALKSDPEMRMLQQLIQGIQTESKITDWDQILKCTGESASRMFDDFQRSRREGADIYAVRIYDSKLTPLPEGIRPAAVDYRRLKFKIGELDLEISIYPVSTDSRELIGQIHKGKFDTPPDARLKAGKLSFTATADRFNLFRFERIPADNYKLTLSSAGDTIGIVDLSV